MNRCKIFFSSDEIISFVKYHTMTIKCSQEKIVGCNFFYVVYTVEDFLFGNRQVSTAPSIKLFDFLPAFQIKNIRGRTAVWNV
ncbi:hypothetical protein ES705_44176 [subsurface metagenome]